jgi:hypothetical protein
LLRLRGSARAALAFAAVTLASAPVAYTSMFSSFLPYDDEGSHLLMLRGYISGHSLYTQLITYHGPLFYETMGGFFTLTGLAITNDSGRLLTMFVWLLASLAAGLGAYRLTRSLLLALASQLLTFNLLSALTNEPMQPSGLVSLLLVGLIALAAYQSRWPRATAVLIGALAAAACMVKINVGAFAVVAVAFAFAAGLTGRKRRMLLPATGLLLCIVPFAVMFRLLDRGWVIDYALAAALGVVSLTIVVSAAGPEPSAPPRASLLIGGGAAVAIAVTGVAMVGGTRLFDLVNSIFVLASRQPLVYVDPLDVKLWVVLCAASSLALAVAVATRRHRVPPMVSASGRIAAGLLMWICILLPPSYLLMLAAPLVWVVVLAPRGSPDRVDPYVRLLLPSLALMESLQAYPVAGTQNSIASLGIVFAGAITINDGIGQLRAKAAGHTRSRLLGVAGFVPSAALIVTVAVSTLWAWLAVTGYAAGLPLGLPGAGLLRLPAQQQADLRALSASIRRDCNSFITMPGLPSLYVWTGQQAPVLLYDSTWIYVLDGAQQQAMVDQVRNVPGMCVVKNDAVVNFWAEGRPVPRGPLIDFIESSFTVSGYYGDYALLVQR